MTTHSCVKESEIARLQEQDKFKDSLLGDLKKTIEKIEGHMQKQTELQERQVRQEEKTFVLQEDQKENRVLIEKLFSLHRELKDALHTHELEPGKEAREDGRQVRIGTLQTVINTLITTGISLLVSLTAINQALGGGNGAGP